MGRIPVTIPANLVAPRQELLKTENRPEPAVCDALTHLAPVLLRTHLERTTGERRMRNLIIALVTLAGVLLVAANAMSQQQSF